MPRVSAPAVAVFVALCAAALAPTPAHASSSPSREEVIERAASLTRAGEWAEVIEVLEPARRADPDSAEVALLLAIAYFRSDRHDEAEPLFVELADHPDGEIADSARLFLGLIARSRGDERAARRLWQDVAASSATLGDSARALLRPGAGRRLVAVASIRSGADSNVPLVSSETVGASPSSADVSLLGTAAVVAWPVADVDLRILAAASYRKQARLTEFDFFAGRAGVQYERPAAGLNLGLGYAFEATNLGGEFLSTGHAADAHARTTGRIFGEGAYALRLRTYRPEAYEGYSGDIHRGIASAGMRFRRGEATLGAVAEGDRARDPDLAGWGVGGRGRLKLRSGDLSIRADAEILPRFLGARQDLRTEVTISLSFALSRQFAARFGASALHNRSTAPEFQHVKVRGYAGVELRL